MSKVVHLIKIEKNTSGDLKTGLACTPDWFGKRMSNDVEDVTCQSCMGTDFYKKKVERING